MLTFIMNTLPKFLNGNKVKVWAIQTSLLNSPINLLLEMQPWPQLLNRQRGLSNQDMANTSAHSPSARSRVPATGRGGD